MEETMIRSNLGRGKGSVYRLCLMAFLGVALALVAFHPCTYAQDMKQKVFSSPEEAVKVLVEAAKGSDVKEMLTILGPEGKEIISSGDEVADKAGRERFIQLYEEMNRLEEESAGKVVLSVGYDDWPLPIPIVKKGEGWVFDTAAGKEEIVNRRIGRNELNVIDVCLAYRDAQREYYGNDWDGNGVMEYAQKLMSDKGKWNGLYWEAGEDEIASPLGPLVASAIEEGYTVKKQGGKPTPYQGYYFRILKAQGKSAPGGAYNYVINGHMVAGFALVAYPAEYGVSGVMTFVVNQNGSVYEKDLSKNTAATAKAMTRYNPDKTWREVARR